MNEHILLFEQLESAFAGRNAQIASDRLFVLGEQWTTEMLALLPEGVTPSVINYAWAICFKNVTFLVARQPEKEILVSEDSKEGREYAQFLEKVTYGLYEANRVQRKYLDFAWNCSIAGGQPIVVDWHPLRRIPQVTGPLPERVFPVPRTDGEDGYQECFIVEHDTVLGVRRRFPAYRGPLEASVTKAGVQYVELIRYIGPDVQLWMLRDGTLVGQRRGYGYCNVVYLPNIPMPAAIEGLSDLTLLREAACDYNQMHTLQKDVADYYADPAWEIRGGVEGARTTDDIQVGKGAVIPVDKDGGAKMIGYEGTGPDFGLVQERYRSIMQDLGGMPDITFGRYEASIQSGIALSTQFQPTRLLMGLKQNCWDAAFAEVDRMMFDMMRRFVGDAKPVDLYGMAPQCNAGPWRPFSVTVRSSDLSGYVRSRFIWPGMLPKDDATEATTLLNQYQSGAVSLYTYLEKMGFESPPDEIERIKDEFADPLLHPERVQEEPEVAPGTDTMTPAMPDLSQVGGMPTGGVVPAGLSPQDSTVADPAAYEGRMNDQMAMM